MDHILNVGDVQSSGSHISANQDHRLLILLGGVFRAQVHGLAINLLDSGSEPIQVLKTLPLLHLTVKARVLQLQELKDVGDTLGAGNTVAENNCGLAFTLVKVVVHVEVFLFSAAAHCVL